VSGPPAARGDGEPTPPHQPYTRGVARGPGDGKITPAAVRGVAGAGRGVLAIAAAGVGGGGVPWNAANASCKPASSVCMSMLAGPANAARTYVRGTDGVDGRVRSAGAQTASLCMARLTYTADAPSSMSKSESAV
jgi:hypothetical protein